MDEDYLDAVRTMLSGVEVPRAQRPNTIPWFLVAGAMTFGLLVLFRPPCIMTEASNGLEEFSYSQAILSAAFVTVVMYYAV